MGLIANIIAGVRALMGGARMEREMDEELRGFLEASAESKLRDGMTPEEAARAARVRWAAPMP